MADTELGTGPLTSLDLVSSLVNTDSYGGCGGSNCTLEPEAGGECWASLSYTKRTCLIKKQTNTSIENEICSEDLMI